MESPPQDGTDWFKDILDKYGLDNLASALDAIRSTDVEPPLEPIWPNKPLFNSIYELNDIVLRDPRRHYQANIVFKVPIGFTHLAAPLSILPPEILPDPLLKDWAWVETAIPLGSRQAVMKVIHKLIDNPPKVGTIPQRSKDQETVLKASEAMWKAKGMVTIVDLAKKLKMPLTVVLDRINELKNYGEWPYATDLVIGDPDDRDEIEIADEIIERLRNLPSRDTARRIVNLVIAGKPWAEQPVKPSRSTAGLVPYKRRIVNLAMSMAEPKSEISIKQIAETLKRNHQYVITVISTMRVNKEWPNGLLDIGEALDENGVPRPKKVRKKVDRKPYKKKK